MKKNVYCLIDTETAKMSDVYDLGVLIFDKKGNILFTRNYLNTDVFYNDELMENAYYNYKKPLYEKDCNLVYTNTKFMLHDFYKVRNNFNVTHILGYNLSFDLNALNKTSEKFTGKSFNLNNYKLTDVMRVAIETILMTEKYKDFCRKNNEITEKGNYKSSAETVYRYINDNIDFVENHTALSDCYCEYSIFMKCLKQKKNVSIGTKSNLWKLIQDTK